MEGEIEERGERIELRGRKGRRMGLVCRQRWRKRKGVEEEQLFDLRSQSCNL